MAISLSVSECVCKSDKGYIFASQNANIFFEVNRSGSEYSVIGSIPGESLFSSRLIGRIEKYDDMLIFIPGTASNLWIYNIHSNDWKKIEIQNKEMIGNVKFLSSCIHEGKVYMFGCHYPAIVSVDLETNEAEYDFEVLKPLLSKANAKQDCFFRSDIAEVDGKIYLASCSDNSVLKYNPETQNGEFIRVGNDNDRFSGITYDGESFWLAPRLFGDVIKWDGKQEKRYSLPKMNDSYTSLLSLGITIDKDRNIIVPNINYNYQFVKSPEEEIFIAEKSENKVLSKVIDDQIISIDRKGEIKIFDGNETYSYSIDFNDITINEYLRRQKFLDIESLSITESDMPLSTYLEII